MHDVEKNAVPNIFSEIIYDDAPAAIAWLAKAFGFVEGEIIDGPNGTIAHAEMHYGGGTIMPKSPMTEFGMKSPVELGGINQCTYMTVDDPDAHCEQARAAGAEILMEPRDMDYGPRNYVARDIEGHIWSFDTYRPNSSSEKDLDDRRKTLKKV